MPEKDSFIVYRSFYVGLQALKNKDRLQLYDAIFEYALNHVEIDLKPLPKAMFQMIQPQLQANHRKFLNGLKGGQVTKDLWAKQGQKAGQSKGKVTANVNVNENVNENVNKNGGSLVIAGSRINLPLKNGEDVRLDEDYIKQLNKTYPLINVENELQKMRTWLMSNPNKQKTARGTPRFVSSWLSKIGNSNVKTEMSYADIHKAVLEAKNVRK